jgi:DNA-directed RNA polymerase I, II, and III subunit RPABC1
MSEVYYDVIKEMLQDRGYKKLPEKINHETYIKSDNLNNLKNMYIYDYKDEKLTLTSIRKNLKKIYEYYRINTKIDLNLHILILKKNIQKIEINIFNKNIPFIQKLTDKEKGIFDVTNKSLTLEEVGDNYPIIEYYDTEDLIINITKHNIMPKFEVYNTDEKKKEILDLLDNINPKLFPKMLISDPISKYYNLKIGDIIKIIRTSPLSGEVISFRIII